MELRADLIAVAGEGDESLPFQSRVLPAANQIHESTFCNERLKLSNDKYSQISFSRCLLSW